MGKMTTSERASYAATIKNRKEYARRLEEYLANPNKCLACGAPIVPTGTQIVSDIKHKKFCNTKCFGVYSRKPVIQKPKAVRALRPNSVLLRSKADFSSAKNYHSRVRCNSRSTFRASGRDLVCAVCGYSKFVEICHIKDLKDFTEDTSVSIINSIDNLVALCPNHHWEFDHGLISL